MRAAAEAFATGPLTIARVVSLAGVGRNTFYEYFDDPEHALALAEATALRGLEARARDEIEAARTPLEKLRALSRAWFAELDQRPLEFRVALRPPHAWQPGALSPAGRVLQDTLQRLLDDSRASVGLAVKVSVPRVIAVASAAEAFSRARLADASIEQENELIEVMVRLLR